MSGQVVPLERLKERLQREPCSGAMQLLAETYYQQEQHLQAVETSRRGLELYPDSIDLRLILGQSLFALERFTDVEEALQPLLTEISRLAVAFATLEQLYSRQGRVQEAMRAAHLYRLLCGKEAETEGKRQRHTRRTLKALQKWQQALDKILVSERLS